MLSYSLEGIAPAPTILFLHGFLGCKEDWNPMIAFLKARFSCLTMDLPGHGSSAFEEDAAEAVMHTLTKLKIHPMMVVGYSVGGRIALRLKFPTTEWRPFLLILSANPGAPTAIDMETRKMEETKWVKLLEKGSMADFLNAWYEQPMFAPIKKNEQLFKSMLEKRLQNDPKNMLSFYKANAPGLLPAPTLPAKDILFLCGEMDKKYSDLYQKTLKRKQFVSLAQCGHVLHLENPYACAQITEICSEVANA